MKQRLNPRIIFLGVFLFPGGVDGGNDYTRLRAAEVRKCEAVDPGEYQSGLFFNPDGYRSYYLRSLCYQNAAVEFRDAGLCAPVRQRRALFSSSWGYSRSNCEKLVAEGIRKDRETIEQMRREYEQGHVRITGFRIERNGNGRDFDIVPAFDGAAGHAYRLRFELLPRDPAGSPVLLHASGYYLQGRGDNIRIYVPRADLRRRFPAFSADQIYEVNAILVYSIGTGTQSGKWSESFIESVFPEEDRTQRLAKKIRF